MRLPPASGPAATFDIISEPTHIRTMDNRPVGVYDSGLGGLTVWRELRRALPGESLLYLGDGKNCPYGARPREEVRRLACEAVDYLVAEGCKLVVVACNTATAAAIDFLRERYPDMPLVGMEPAVKPACLHTRSGVVGVLAPNGASTASFSGVRPPAMAAVSRW